MARSQGSEDPEPAGDDRSGWNPAVVVGRLSELGGATVTELVKLGRDSLLTALVAALDALGAGVSDPDAGQAQGPRITRRLLAGDGRLTRAEVAEAAGVELAVATRLWRAVGFPEVGDGHRVFTTADVAALRDAHGLVTAGVVDTSGAVALARPMGQLLSRLAAAHTALVADVLGARLGAQHDAGVELGDPLLDERVTAEAVAATQELLPALERMTLYVWRRHLAAAAGRELVPAADQGTDAAPQAVGFIDVSGFTRLSRTTPIPELEDLLDRFEATVWDAVVDGGGRVVKTLGDEVLFLTDTAESAARIVLGVVDEVAQDGVLPPVHAGLAWGPVLHRGGDVYGPVVNIASRLTGLARPGTLRVDQACADQLAGCPDLQLDRRTARAVRGYDHLPSYRLRRRRD